MYDHNFMLLMFSENIAPVSPESEFARAVI